MEQKWLVWSTQHELWWQSKRMGYTNNIKNAGRYSFDEAREIVEGANKYANSTAMPHETMMPAPEE